MLGQAQGVQAEMNMGEIIKRVGAARGIEMNGLIKTDEQKQQEAQQAEQRMKQERFHELLKSASPEIIKQFGPDMMGGGGEQMPAQPQMPAPEQLPS